MKEQIKISKTSFYCFVTQALWNCQWDYSYLKVIVRRADHLLVNASDKHSYAIFHWIRTSCINNQMKNKKFHNNMYKTTIDLLTEKMGLRSLTPLPTIFQLYCEVRFIDRGNLDTRRKPPTWRKPLTCRKPPTCRKPSTCRKPPTYRKPLTNFMTWRCIDYTSSLWWAEFELTT